MNRNYTGWKPGTNSRGLPSRDVEQPKNYANSVTSKETDIAKSFAATCKKATDVINDMIEQGRLPESFWNTKDKYEEVKPTARQYRRYRQGHGLAYQYGR